MRKLYFLILTLLVVTLCAWNITSFAQASHLVISQVYGGGGNSGATYKNDFIEIYNPTGATVDLTGWSVQYASSTGTSWSKTSLSGSIAPGAYYLVQQAAGSGGTTNLPPPDATGTLALAGTAGKVALVQSTTALSGSCPTSVVDLVGFGSANCFEGSAGTPAPSNTTAVLRKNNGCTDTDNNAIDFETGAPSPRNSASPANNCTSCTPPTNQPTGLTFTSTATTLSGSFSSAAEGTTPANAYLVLASTSDALSSQPVSGATYAVGSPLGDNATVVSSSSATAFTVNGLLPSTTYYFFVYSYNTTGNCYNKIAPLSGSATTANAPTVSVAAGTDAAEPATNGTFTISLSEAAPAGGITLNYTLSGSATQGADFSNPQTGTLTIAEGSSSATLTINVTDDDVFEGPEILTLTLNSASNSYVLAEPTASINVRDNERPTVVINQVYGGGGNSGALYTHDFIELYNSGNTPVNLDGWSLQYKSAAGSDAWIVHNLTGTIPAHSFFLVQEAKGNTGTKALPNPDAIGTLGLSGSAGKVALCNSTTALTGANPEGTSVMDKVGYGSSATGFETAPAPGTDNTTAVHRFTDGVDTDNNSVDFVVGAPEPRNTSYTTTPPTIASLTPPNNQVDAPSTVTLALGFDKPVQKGTGTITIVENGVASTIDVASAEVELTSKSTVTIHTSLATGKTYSIQITAGAFTDMYGNAFAGITDNTGWTFTTYNSAAALTLPVSFAFQNCSGSGLLANGFTQYSATGVQVWDCSPFGKDNSNGVQMNGYDGETNVPNVDWLISPKMDLTGTDFPLLSFWSRTAFNGKPLQLKISTNYTGGDPAGATWTDLNGKFPAETSNTWTESKDINLSRFKSNNVHIAFVYTSSTEDGARWTLDDIAIVNSATPPPPSLTVGTADLQLGYAAKGSNSDKAFTFIGNDLVEDVTLTATAPFLLSKDGSSFASSITYSVSEANNKETTVWVRFAPTEKNKDFTGSAKVSTSTLSYAIALKGTSINPEGTLEVVNWNVEWFGSTEFGPANEDLQEANIAKVMKNLNADLYGLGEVVSEERLQRVVSQMPGYAYVIGNFGSHTNPYASKPSPLSEAQKLAFVYKTSVIKNLGTRPMLSVGIDTKEDLGNPQYNNWSSGRFPLLMKADVTLNCVTRPVNFVMVHAKANTSPTDISYDRRAAGAVALHDSLNILFPDANVVVLGDFNDDLDLSITAGKTTTSWSAFTTDNVNYTALTLPLSEAGKKSTVSHNDVIDHVVVSNEMVPYYMEGTASVVTDVTSMVSNYGSTTSDHYPVFTRYRFEEPAAPAVTTCPENKTFCVSTEGTYTIGRFEAIASCGAVVYSYAITGATTRKGESNDASGAFSVGTSTITWTATDALGNSSSCQTTVTVNARPQVVIADAYALPAGTSANTVYTGYSPASSLTLTAEASGGASAYSYTWQDGTAGAVRTVSPTTKTTYTVTATDANGCNATADKEVLVMDVRAGKNYDKVLVCHHGPAQTHNLAVELVDVPDHLAHGDQLGGCDTDPLTRQGAATLELVVEAQPNPSAGAFTIIVRGGDASKTLQLIVTDLHGRVVETREGLQSDSAIKLGGHYRSGVYLLSVVYNGERHSLKLVKR